MGLPATFFVGACARNGALSEDLPVVALGGRWEREFRAAGAAPDEVRLVAHFASPSGKSHAAEGFRGGGP